MTRSDTLRSEVARLQAAEAGLRRKVAHHEGAAATARAAGAKKRRDASKTRSETTQRTALRSAEDQDKKVAAAEKKIGDLKTKLAANAKSQADKTRSLDAEARREKQITDRAEQRRRQGEKAHVREVTRLSVPTVRYVEIQPPEPEQLRVLYLTANPEASDQSVTAPDGTVTTTSSYLRLDAEVREVQRALRAARYRDLVTVEHRPAATADDLIDAINDVRPHVVHFSGHGWVDGVVLDSGDLNDPIAHPVEFDLLAQVLAATDTPPRVLVLNACETLAGAELLLPAVPVVIAMADTIDDTAAIVFARRFYAAIASAQSIASALAQARAAMRVAALDDADLPQSASRDDVNLEDLVLVVPPGIGGADRAADLLREQGLSGTALAILQYVQQVEADESFAGVLSDHQVVDAVGGTARAIRTELQRLLDGDYIRASGEERDLGGGWDLIRPRLTTRGVATLAS